MVLGIFSKYLWSQIKSSISHLIPPIAIFKKKLEKQSKTGLTISKYHAIIIYCLSAAFLFIQNELRFVD
jgi:hypothetical protein